MPADVSYLFSLSPPYSCSSTFNLFDHKDDGDFLHLPCDDFNPSTSNRIPHFSLRTLKSCLKHNQPDLKVVSSGPVSGQKSTRRCDKVAEKHTSKGKKVTFADAQGGVLALVKYVSESSNTPPKCFLSDRVIAMSQSSLSAKGNPDFSLQFEQPVADYFKFRQKLKEVNVILESVSIANAKRLQGTVKVKNIVYQKTVNVRISYDDWQSNTDVSCQYVGTDLDLDNFDTFEFSIQLPASLSKKNNIEFCIYFKWEYGEYWDNNGGKNYVIVAKNDLLPSNASSQVSSNCKTDMQGLNLRYPNAYKELPTPEEPQFMNVGTPVRFY